MIIRLPYPDVAINASHVPFFVLQFTQFLFLSLCHNYTLLVEKNIKGDIFTHILHKQSITMADTNSESSHTTSCERNYEAENEALRSRIQHLRNEKKIIQALLDNHKNCSNYRQNSSSSMDSKEGEMASLKCPA